MSQLAKRFGVSDVALAKLCKKHSIPHPPRGYWALLAVGRSPKKATLPPGDEVDIHIDVEANLQRKKQIKEAVHAEAAAVKEAQEQIKTAQCAELHELAARVAKLFGSEKPGSDGRISIRNRTVPQIHASPGVADRVINFLSELAYALEAKGIKLVSGKTINDILSFNYGEDSIHMVIEEGIETHTAELTPEQKRQPSWTWDSNITTRPSGLLTVKIMSPNRTSGRCKWSETERTKLPELLVKIVPRIEELFKGWADQREQQKLREQRWAEERKREAERERQNQHNRRLAEVKNARRTSLFRASVSFRAYRDVIEFLDALEGQWIKKGEISESQQQWMTWARAEAECINPLNTNYPVPEWDGYLDETKIPFEGPYPEAKEFPLPMLLKEIKSMIGTQSSSRSYGW